MDNIANMQSCTIIVWDFFLKVSQTTIWRFLPSLPKQQDSILALYLAGLDGLNTALHTFGSCHENNFPHYAQAIIEENITLCFMSLSNGVMKAETAELINTLTDVTNQISERVNTDLQVFQHCDDLSENRLLKQVITSIINGTIQDAVSKGATHARISLTGQGMTIAHKIGEAWHDVGHLEGLLINGSETFPFLRDIAEANSWFNQHVECIPYHVNCEPLTQTIEWQIK